MNISGLRFKVSSLRLRLGRALPFSPNLKPQTSNLKLGGSAAFTLLELLVAVTVLSLLMVMLFGFFEQATRAWQTSEQKIDAFREVRAALYYLKRDLENAVIDNQIPWYVQNDPGLASDLVSDTAPPDANHGDVVFFISAQPSEAQESGKNKSDLCAIGYYLSYQQDPALAALNKVVSARSYKLYRYYKSSDTTWAEPPVTPTSGLLVYLGLVAGGNPTPPLTNLFIRANNQDEVIARNVINFSVIPYDENLVALDRTGASNIRPAFVEVELSAFNYDTAAKLADQAAWHREATPASRTPLGSQNIQVFKTRVSLKR